MNKLYETLAMICLAGELLCIIGLFLMGFIGYILMQEDRGKTALLAVMGVIFLLFLFDYAKNLCFKKIKE